MTTRRILQPILIFAVLLGALALPTAAARAWTGRCGDFVTAESGDTVESIAAACGTSADAVRSANPGVTSALAVGQVLFVPGGAPSGSLTLTYVTSTGATPFVSVNRYVAQPGDTMGGIAFTFGIPLGTLLALNPQIANPSIIYPGQQINLPGSVPVTPTSTATPSSGLSRLTVSYGHGLLVRTGPGKNFAEIVSPFVGALKDEQFLYRRNSLTTDSTGLVWVEIRLNPASGYTTGWIMTRDALGQYFTRPNIGARIDRRDP